MQRLLLVLALASFICACDVHVLTPAPRLGTALLLGLYSAVTLTLVLSMPMDVAIGRSRVEREAALTAHLYAAGPDASKLTFELSNTTELESGRSGLFSTTLDDGNIDTWQAFVVLRAVLAILAWSIACLIGTGPAFGVPPLPESERPRGAA